MSKLIWDQSGEKLFETGVEQVALYVMGAGNTYGKGVAWNGVTSINESPSGAEPTALYADDAKYLTLYSLEEFGGTIGAYMSPEEFDVCDGSAELATGVSIGQQDRKVFALVYKTKVGNDTEGTDHGYKLHIVYGAQAKPSQRQYQTINNSPSAMDLSWEFTTTPVQVAGMKPTATVTIDSTRVDASKLATLEKKLYGDTSAEPTLVMPDEIKTMFAA